MTITRPSPSPSIHNYPGGSKTRVTKAGATIRNGNPSAEDLRVIDEWREAHRAVLNTFQALLRNRARNKNIIIAQRHKRKNTIFNKLKRFPKMELARMDDIAGCRIIFNSIENLTNFRNELHEAKFNHKKRNESDKYNYIKSPKSTGYRGIHDVYEYDVKSIEGAKSKGLFVEIQYRTAIQHAWATAVEVIGHVTESQPKFQQGDKKFETAMAYASEILARAHEKMKSCYPELENKELVEKFLKIDKEVSLIKLLKSLNSSNDSISRGKNAILIMDSDGRLEIRDFKDATDAIRALFELEKSNPGKDIVLVRADTGEQMRNAFRNYFADAREFVTLIEEGCAQLSGSRKSISTRIKLKQPPK